MAPADVMELTRAALLLILAVAGPLLMASLRPPFTSKGKRTRRTTARLLLEATACWSWLDIDTN